MLNQKVCEVFCSKDRKNVANLHALYVYFKRQYMICQCIITTSFASGRKQTSHGVVRDISFSVVRDNPDELYIQAPLEFPRFLQETFSLHTEPE